MTKPYIKIRFEDEKIPNELNRLYKERGYDSREEMLRDMEYKEMIHKYQNLCELVVTNLAIMNQVYIEGGIMNKMVKEKEDEE